MFGLNCFILFVIGVCCCVLSCRSMLLVCFGRILLGLWYICVVGFRRWLLRWVKVLLCILLMLCSCWVCWCSYWFLRIFWWCF